MLYSCIRCGNPTEVQPLNLFEATHPLGRTCSQCLPTLLTRLEAGEKILDIVLEFARHRKVMDEIEHLIPQDFHVEE